MKGQVLAFDGTTGAITGDDGLRYSFELAEWKGEKPPQALDQADFVAKDASALEVYKGGGGIPKPSLDTVNSAIAGIGANLLDNTSGSPEIPARIAERPQVIFCVIAFLSVFFLNFLVILGSGTSAFDLSELLDQLGATASLLGRNGRLQVASTIAMALWLIPVAAGFTVFRELTGKRSRKAKLATAALCLFSIIVYASALAAMVETTRYDSSDALSLGFVGYLFVMWGIGLALTGIGLLKHVPGLKKYARHKSPDTAASAITVQDATNGRLHKPTQFWPRDWQFMPA
ncbi:MAG: hypothetical protein WBA51_06020 [Erythrobacter sp.]